MKENSPKFYIYIILIFFGFLMFFPFIWMFISSFKGISDIYTYPPRIFPKKWIFTNYKEVLNMIPFLRYYINSIFVATSSTFLQVFVSVLAAFAFSRLQFPGKNLLFMLYIGTLIMPLQVTLIPKFLIVANLKWLDSYQGLIVPVLFNAFSIFFLRQFFYTIPKELEDAAKIDGCGHFTFLFKIVIPLSKPAIGTIALFSFLMEWRSYIWPLIIINKDEMRTLPIGLKYLISEGGGEYHLLMAAAVMTIAPVLIIFFLSEKQFIKGITLTGLKG